MGMYDSSLRVNEGGNLRPFIAPRLPMFFESSSFPPFDLPTFLLPRPWSAKLTHVNRSWRKFTKTQGSTFGPIRRPRSPTSKFRLKRPRSVVHAFRSHPPTRNSQSPKMKMNSPDVTSRHRVKSTSGSAGSTRGHSCGGSSTTTKCWRSSAQT